MVSSELLVWVDCFFYGFYMQKEKLMLFQTADTIKRKTKKNKRKQQPFDPETLLMRRSTKNIDCLETLGDFTPCEQ